MQGSWELSKYLSTNNGTGNESPDKIKRVKVITYPAFTLSLYDVKTGKLTSKVIGTYTLSATKFGEYNYEERIDSSIVGTRSGQNKLFRKSVSIDEADRMIFLWTDNFITYTEIWSRVNAMK